MSNIRIVQASESTLEQTVEVFDLYRQFYQQPTDLASARAFINSRLQKQDTIIYLALNAEQEPLGFTQLFPSFSSVAMKPVYILNDLYVKEHVRKQGIATALLNTARAFAKKNKAHSIKLATAVTNHAAKTLYQRHGYQQINSFDYFSLPLI